MLQWYWWRWRVAREFVKRSDMNLFQAWDYSSAMEEQFKQLIDDEPTDPAEAVACEMSYWSED